MELSANAINNNLWSLFVFEHKYRHAISEDGKRIKASFPIDGVQTAEAFLDGSALALICLIIESGIVYLIVANLLTVLFLFIVLSA